MSPSQVARSPLLDQLQAFLPEFQRSTDQLLTQPQQQLNDLNIENTEEDGKVIEMVSLRLVLVVCGGIMNLICLNCLILHSISGKYL